MRRRDFITLLGGAAVAWPLAARAQQSGKLPIIGVLGSSTSSGWSAWLAPFVQRLREHGWIEGRTVAIEYRWAEGRAERFAEIAAEFVRLKVDVIFTSGGGAPAAKRATSTIPIVFAVANDPVGVGLVKTLARPGGNATGLSLQQPDLAGKRIEMLREVVPGLRRLAIMANVTNPSNPLELGEIQVAARKLDLETVSLEIRNGREIVPSIEALKAHLTYIVTAYGKPRSKYGLGNDFAKWATDAGLQPRCRLHGLKEGEMRRLAESGNTAHELMAVSGHRTLSEVQRYCNDADRKRLADSAMAKKQRGQSENSQVANLDPKLANRKLSD